MKERRKEREITNSFEHNTSPHTYILWGLKDLLGVFFRPIMRETSGFSSISLRFLTGLVEWNLCSASTAFLTCPRANKHASLVARPNILIHTNPTHLGFIHL